MRREILEQGQPNLLQSSRVRAQALSFQLLHSSPGILSAHTKPEGDRRTATAVRGLDRQPEGTSARSTHIDVRGIQLDDGAEYVEPLTEAGKLPHVPEASELRRRLGRLSSSSSSGWALVVEKPFPSRHHDAPKPSELGGGRGDCLLDWQDRARSYNGMQPRLTSWIETSGSEDDELDAREREEEGGINGRRADTAGCWLSVS